MFKNMKIEINEAQPLDEVVIELERLGFKCGLNSENPKSIETYSDGEFDEYCFKQEPTTNLAELKEVQCKI